MLQCNYCGWIGKPIDGHLVARSTRVDFDNPLSYYIDCPRCDHHVVDHDSGANKKKEPDNGDK